MLPQVTVIVPVYNDTDNLRTCLDGLRGSLEAPVECIVVDDGSTDGSADVAREFGAKVLSTGGRSGTGSGTQHRRTCSRRRRSPLYRLGCVRQPGYDPENPGRIRQGSQSRCAHGIVRQLPRGSQFRVVVSQPVASSCAPIVTGKSFNFLGRLRGNSKIRLSGI